MCNSLLNRAFSARRGRIQDRGALRQAKVEGAPMVVERLQICLSCFLAAVSHRRIKSFGLSTRECGQVAAKAASFEAHPWLQIR
jgi:hypothetical protein